MKNITIFLKTNTWLKAKRTCEWILDNARHVDFSRHKILNISNTYFQILADFWYVFGKHHYFIHTKFHRYANLFKVQIFSGLILLDYWAKETRKIVCKLNRDICQQIVFFMHYVSFSLNYTLNLKWKLSLILKPDTKVIPKCHA